PLHDALPIFTALKPEAEAWLVPPSLVPRRPTLENFAEMFEIVPRLPRFLGNSFIYGLGVSLVSLGVAVPAAYGLSRHPIPGRRGILFPLVYANMFAPIMLLVPLYDIIRVLGPLNTRPAMILPASVFTLPPPVPLLASYFEAVPRSLEEAAWVDGCSRLRALGQVVLPLVLPAMVAVAIYAFITGWSQQFVLALVLIQSPDLMPITQGLYQFFSRSS